MPQFADNTTPLTLPAAYVRALVLSLAIELAPQYDVAPTPTLMKQALEARRAASPVPGKVPVPGTDGQEDVPPPGIPTVPVNQSGQ
jgi:hypothetical protein